MEKIRVILLGILTLVLVNACTDNDMAKRQELNQEVLKFHDEIMVKMQDNGRIEEKIRLLLKKADSDTTTVLYQHKGDLLRASENLEMADNAMMDWMATYQFPAEDIPTDEAINYMNTKKAEIIEVGEQMDRAGAEALKQIDKINNPAKYQE